MSPMVQHPRVITLIGYRSRFEFGVVVVVLVVTIVVVVGAIVVVDGIIRIDVIIVVPDSVLNTNT
jgi:hypothetical protein